jgi:hypothetical protein
MRDRRHGPIRAVARLIRLSPPERRLLVRAAWLLVLLRLALAALPLPLLERLVRRLARARSGTAPSVDQIGWALAAAARRVPGASCLVQALAARILLGRQRIPAVVRLGVARERGAALASHAWVESEGRVVVGDAHLDRYVPIATWGTR